MSNFPKDSTIVLVHAAWADGSCWVNVILPLQQRGLRVICAPISMKSLTEDANALSRVLGGDGEVHRRERLGGLLNYYYRKAA